MSGFVKFWMLLSIVGLLNHVSVQGNSFHRPEKLSEPDFFVYPKDEKPKNNKINSLEIYSEKEFLKEFKKDNRLVAKFAQRVDEFHKTITSAVLATKPGENVVHSPISISTLLMMMTLGARGHTLNEIYDKLHLYFTRDELFGFKELIKIFKDTTAVELNFANRIFISRDIQIQREYNNSVSKILDSTLQSISFDNPVHAAELINSWCKKQTRNHITEITNPNSLTNALLVLANAVYFKGDWKIPFDKKYTSQSTFYISKKKTVKVPMMRIQNEFGWGRIKELQTKFVELPYKADENTNDTFSMYVLVPEKVDGLAHLEKNLDLIDFTRLNMIEELVQLFLPRFKIESTLEFKPILKKMGISRMFDRRADFRGMVENKQVYVSKMVQKAFLEVNEKGSTAAAVTTADFANRMSPAIINVDRPFVCVIVLTNLGIPLFHARVVDPSKLQ